MTTVNSNHSNRTLDIINTGDSVTFRFDAAGDRYADRISADRAEFIRAIETELDGTWINHADLPKVTPLPDGLVECGRNVYHTDYDHRAEVMERLAVARYLEANPPVDQAAVDALAKVLDGIDDELDSVISDAPAYARRLVQAGVRAPETSAP